MCTGMCMCLCMVFLYICMCAFQIGIYFVSAILKQQKRKHKVEKFNPYTVSGTKSTSSINDPQPGDRPDNMWHHYHKEDVYQSLETWDSTTFVEKTHWGYYCWPKYVLYCGSVLLVQLSYQSKDHCSRTF